MDCTMVVLTAIYVVATIILCVFNGITARSTKTQTEKFIEQYNESNRPIVTVHFEVVRDGLLCFVIENEGSKSAHNVCIDINDDFINNIQDEKNKSRLQELKIANLFLSCNQNVYVFIGTKSDFKTISSITAEIKVHYDTFEESTEINLEHYAILLDYLPADDSIAQSIKTIGNQNANFHKNILKQVKSQRPIKNIVVHQETEDEANKFKIYKLICCNGSQSVYDISEYFSLNNDYVFKLLQELENVDRLVQRLPDYPQDINDYSVKWGKK